MTIGAEIDLLFTTRGDSEYGGEAVSPLEHALQAAAADRAAKVAGGATPTRAHVLPLLSRVARV